jgi:hypothetical protein
MLRSILTLVLMAALVLPASADATLALLPAAPTARVHYRVVRTQQTAQNPAISVTSFDLVRRTGTTLVLERTSAGGTPNDSVLTQAADGSLALAEDARGVAADADLADALYAVNLAIAATRSSDATAKGSWLAAIPLASTAGAPAASVTIQPGPVEPGTSGGFDFSGSGDTIANASPVRRPPPQAGFPGAGGGPGGGGYPRHGSGEPGGSGSPGPSGAPGDSGTPARAGGMAVSVRVDGHANGGYVTRIAITQTRSVTVAGLPFVNVGSWAVTVGQ